MNSDVDSGDSEVEEGASENETRERRYNWSQMYLDELVGVEVPCNTLL